MKGYLVAIQDGRFSNTCFTVMHDACVSYTDKKAPMSITSKITYVTTDLQAVRVVTATFKKFAKTL